ncbi:hypothetical protein OU798_04065 [Prolixibacteraceae bacterium Z1-6]|uniref:Uncharacterized protein n=1 Tax=Draconibacterium aestuarii TaxID=2998507 RepID=A0A9X3J545_9BACT|nr:hypothetical protein [Prolixibacteraceae bacterium Z1-6]
MDANDIFQKKFRDDDGKVFRFERVNNCLNVIIDGQPFWESGVPYKLEKDVEYLFSVYDCIQSVNGIDLKIYFSRKEDQWVAVHGVINANLAVIG